MVKNTNIVGIKRSIRKHNLLKSNKYVLLFFIICIFVLLLIMLVFIKVNTTFVSLQGNSSSVIPPSQVATPTSNPTCGTILNNSSYIILSTATPNANIYYNFDGSDPTTSDTLYTVPFLITRTTQVYAKAFKDGYTPSEVFNCDFFLNVANPIPNPMNGIYSGAIDVSLSSQTIGADIYYTLDGSNPTTSSIKYLSPIHVSDDEYIKTRAYKEGYTPSAILGIEYIINDKPIFNPSSYTVNILTTTPANTPILDLNAGDPDNSPDPIEYFVVSGNTNYFNVDEDTGIISTKITNIPEDAYILEVSAYDGIGYSDTNATIGIIVNNVVATPTANPIAGTYSSSLSITLSTITTGAYIYYTVDGSEPTKLSTLYNSQINISTSTTIKAKAFKSGIEDSGVLVANYILESPYNAVATPTANPVAGTYSSTQSVVLSTSTSGASIYYTTNGDTPTTNSQFYNGAPISINTTTTLKAIAVKTGFVNSEVFTGTYIISNSGNGGNGGQGGSGNTGGSGTSGILQVTPVVFSVLEGEYSSVQNLSLSTTTPGASIYYTLDGNTPTQNSTKYISPIVMDKNLTIKARAYKDGYTPSQIFTKNYIIILSNTTQPQPITINQNQQINLISKTENSIVYELKNIKDKSTLIDINLSSVSLSSLVLVGTNFNSSIISILNENNFDYDLFYIDKIYDVFDINISNLDKIEQVSLDFAVNRDWLVENNINSKDMIAYFVSDTKESILNIKYLGNTENRSLYSITVSPIQGRIILGSQSIEYKEIRKDKKIMGFILLGCCIIVLIFIILLIIRLNKHNKLKDKPKENNQSKKLASEKVQKEKQMENNLNKKPVFEKSLKENPKEILKDIENIIKKRK